MVSRNINSTNQCVPSLLLGRVATLGRIGPWRWVGRHFYGLCSIGRWWSLLFSAVSWVGLCVGSLLLASGDYCGSFSCWCWDGGCNDCALAASGLANTGNDNADDDDGDHHKQHKTCYRDSHSNAHNAVAHNAVVNS